MIIYLELSKIIKEKFNLQGKNINELYEDNDLRHIVDLNNYPEIKNKFKDYISILDNKEYLIDEVIDCFEFESDEKVEFYRNYIVTKNELEKYIKPLIKKKEDLKNFNEFIFNNFNEEEDYVFFEYYPF